jgi:RNA polymerase sigma-70 factor (ECF subfamily)
MTTPAGRSREPWQRAILEQNRRWLLAYFIAATGDAHRAEDLVQDVFAAAVKNAEQFDPSRSFGAWLRGIARNLLLMSYRDSRSRVLSLDPAVLSRLDEAAAQAESAHAVPGYSELRQQVLRDCLKTIPDRGRKVLGLKYAEGKVSRDIAQETGMQVGAVDMLLSRLRRALQECTSRKLAALRHG